MTSLLYALGLDGEEILNTFYNHVVYKRVKTRMDACRSMPSA